jgi:hypothetical protein
MRNQRPVLIEFATAQFTSAGTASVLDWTATNGTIYAVHCVWVCSNDTSNKGAVFTREMACEFIGGTLSQIGSTDNAGTTDKISAGFYGAGSPDVVLDVNTDKIRARFIHSGTDTVNVNVYLTIQERVQA